MWRKISLGLSVFKPANHSVRKLSSLTKKRKPLKQLRFRLGQVFNEFVLTVAFLILGVLVVGMALFIIGVIATQYYVIHYTVTKFVEHPSLYRAFATNDASQRRQLLEIAIEDALSLGNSFAESFFGVFLKDGLFSYCVTKHCPEDQPLRHAKLALLVPQQYVPEGSGTDVTWTTCFNVDGEDYTYDDYFPSVDLHNLDLYPVLGVARITFPPPFSLLGIEFTAVSQKVPSFLAALRGISSRPTYNLSQVPNNSSGQGASGTVTPTPTPSPTPCQIETVPGGECQNVIQTPGMREILSPDYCHPAGRLKACTRGCRCEEDDD